MAGLIGINIINVTVTRAIMNAEVELIQVLRTIIEDAYDAIINASPIFTGYYASNHRITIRGENRSIKAGSSTPKLFPSSKPRVTTENIYFANISSARSEELAKLNDLEVGDTVMISTAVPYAEEIEQNHSVYTGIEHLFRV